MRRSRRIGSRESDRLRRKVLARDKYRCTKCGRPGRLEAHHKIPVERGGLHEMGNLVTLCVDCHLAAHREDRLARMSPERRAWHEYLFPRGADPDDVRPEVTKWDLRP